MGAPIYMVCAGSPGVTELLGAEPRIYPFGQAPQGVAKPYVVWQVINGSPFNFISGQPSMDRYGIQIDVYADDDVSVEQVTAAVRKAIGPHCYVTGFNIEGQDPVTQSYRKSFDVAWLVSL